MDERRHGGHCHLPSRTFHGRVEGMGKKRCPSSGVILCGQHQAALEELEASAASWAVSCVRRCASSGVRCPSRRRTSPVARRGVKERCGGAVTSGRGWRSGHWRRRTSAHGGGARHAMAPKGDPPPCGHSDDEYAALETGRPDNGPTSVSRSPATSTAWWGRPCARRRDAAGGSWEANESRVSQITIASIHEKPRFFNKYTPWMATEPSSPKVAKSPDNVIMAGFSGSFARCPLSTF